MRVSFCRNYVNYFIFTASKINVTQSYYVKIRIMSQQKILKTVIFPTVCCKSQHKIIKKLNPL